MLAYLEIRIAALMREDYFHILYIETHISMVWFQESTFSIPSTPPWPQISSSGIHQSWTLIGTSLPERYSHRFELSSSVLSIPGAGPTNNCGVSEGLSAGACASLTGG